MIEEAIPSQTALKAERDGLWLAHTIIAAEWQRVHVKNREKGYTCWPTEQQRNEQRYQDAGYEMGLRRAMFLMLTAMEKRRHETEEWTPEAEGVYMAKRADAPSWATNGDAWRLLHTVQQAAGEHGEDTVSVATAREVCDRWQW